MIIYITELLVKKTWQSASQIMFYDKIRALLYFRSTVSCHLQLISVKLCKSGLKYTRGVHILTLFYKYPSMSVKWPVHVSCAYAHIYTPCLAILIEDSGSFVIKSFKIIYCFFSASCIAISEIQKTGHVIQRGWAMEGKLRCFHLFFFNPSKRMCLTWPLHCLSDANVCTYTLGFSLCPN